MCDIDRFKSFNDTWGHATGDQVLRLVSSAMKANTKGRDLAARYGGEEFAVVLPHTMLFDAVTVAEHIRASIETKKVVKKSTGESLGKVTISIGVAQYLPGETVDDVLQRADTHLYAAKETGRNRVCWMPRHDDAGATLRRAMAGGTAQGGGADASPAARPAIELQFEDTDTPVVVDAELRFVDERLIALHEWWCRVRQRFALPPWRDGYLEDIAFLRDNVHLYEIDPAGGRFFVRFMGASVVHALGEDLSGRILDPALENTGVRLRTTMTRVFEAANLARHVQGPLRTYAKDRHNLLGLFKSESLWLPFQGADRQLVLTATILTPAGESSLPKSVTG
jgi:diguanylate cyclase (GGDEF)-like protein